MSWATAELEWSDFQNRVRLARERLHCSNSGAWFRGVTDCDYPVVPSLFRKPPPLDPDFHHEFATCNNEIDEFRSTYREHGKQERALRQARRKGDPVTEDELSLRTKMAALRASKDHAKARLRRVTLVPSGERDAYVEWCFRSGKRDEPSWVILAEMRHSGVPTRLLDWSESILVSLFFACAKYRHAVKSYCQKTGSRLESLNGDVTALESYLPPLHRTPAVWVVNPYRASERATSRTRIWDLSRDRFDYYEAFIDKREWPYDGAVPAFSPWSSGRIAAQQGLFTVWGHDRRPLDQQLGKDCIAQEVLSPAGALFAVRFLRDVAGIDHFSLYRDLDSLAVRLSEKFFDRALT